MNNSKIALIVMDGMGCNNDDYVNAIKQAHTPLLDDLINNYPNVELKAHGTAVGLPSDDDMGNSEVGHNVLGCGQIYSQGAKLVDQSIGSKRMFNSDTWQSLINNCIANHSTLHFIGLLSDGNVHSNIAHLKSMLEQAKKAGIEQVRCHILLDGRDVPATSALEYVNELENHLKNLNDKNFCGLIASGGGRMIITMDRYRADWDMVKLGWDTHVHGIGRQFATATEAISTYRNELFVIDQNLPPFVIANDGIPVGKIDNNDSVILFNFRGDRAIEISMAFEDKNFNFFDRGLSPKVLFAGMLQYDGDLLIPKRYLVSPPEIKNTLTELLNENKIPSFAVSETQKFGHVTYFWNGNKSEKFDEELETWYEIKSDNVPFEQRPWMKSAEITDKMIDAIKSDQYRFIRCNFPNADMVGHTGSINSTIIGVESVDLALSRILKVADLHDFTVLITADHGNADQMFEKNKDGEYIIRTAHSLNPVPFIIYSKDKIYQLKQNRNFGLANVAPTIAEIFGIIPFLDWEESMLQW